MLKVEGVTKKFDDFYAVDNLNFSVDKGEIIGILGANGAGKTTTFRMILGVLAPNSGTITYNGEEIGYHNSDDIGFLAEERALLPNFTVVKQLSFFAELKGMQNEEIKTAIDYWLDVFELSEHKKSKIKVLSKGNQQKIQFISAVLHNPKLLILDEPFSGLDPFNVNKFKKVILELKSRGVAIIFSSHRLDHVELFCENICVLVKGKTVLQGMVSEIKKDAKMFNVSIKGNVTKDIFDQSSFIAKVQETLDGYVVSVTEYEKIHQVFQLIKDYKIEKFNVELPSLEEVFIEKVGAAYEA